MFEKKNNVLRPFSSILHFHVSLVLKTNIWKSYFQVLTYKLVWQNSFFHTLQNWIEIVHFFIRNKTCQGGLRPFPFCLVTSRIFSTNFDACGKFRRTQAHYGSLLSEHNDPFSIRAVRRCLLLIPSNLRVIWHQ